MKGKLPGKSDNPSGRINCGRVYPAGWPYPASLERPDRLCGEYLAPDLTGEVTRPTYLLLFCRDHCQCRVEIGF